MCLNIAFSRYLYLLCSYRLCITVLKGSLISYKVAVNKANSRAKAQSLLSSWGIFCAISKHQEENTRELNVDVVYKLHMLTDLVQWALKVDLSSLPMELSTH